MLVRCATLDSDGLNHHLVSGEENRGRVLMLCDERANPCRSTLKATSLFRRSFLSEMLMKGNQKIESSTELDVAKKSCCVLLSFFEVGTD